MRVKLSAGPKQGLAPTVKAMFESLTLPMLDHHPLSDTRAPQYDRLPSEIKAALNELYQANQAIGVTTHGDALFIAMGHAAPDDPIDQLIMVTQIFAAHGMIVRVV